MDRNNLIALLLGVPFMTGAVDNLRFQGALVQLPCNIVPGEENIPLDFGTVVDKTLYSHQRSNSQRFSLRLRDCDITIGGTLKVTFSGKENLELPGLLALDAGSTATGIAIGLETEVGAPLALGHEVNYALIKGDNLVSFQAYIRGEPDAISKQTIGRGPFSATATFMLDYE